MRERRVAPYRPLPAAPTHAHWGGGGASLIPPSPQAGHGEAAVPSAAH